MRSPEIRRYEMLIRVRNFGAAHDQLFPVNSSAHAAFAIVSEEIEQLEKLDVTERLATHSARAARKVAARKALVEELTRAQHTARVLEKTIPQLSELLEPPDTSDDQMLVTVARQFIAGIVTHAETFASHGIAVDELRQQVDGFEAVLNERGVRRDEQVQARARIEASLARAMDAVATLDVVVSNQLKTDAPTLATWWRERRESPLKRPKNAVVRSAVATTPEAAPATAPEAEPTTDVVPPAKAA